MKCSPLTFREFIQDEQGNHYAPLVSYDVDGQMWHIVGTETDYVVMVPNMIDAGIYRWHKAHESMPPEIAAQLVTTNAQVLTPKQANQRAAAALQKEIDARNAPARAQSGRGGDVNKNPQTPPAKTLTTSGQSGTGGTDKKDPATSQSPETESGSTDQKGGAGSDDKA